MNIYCVDTRENPASYRDYLRSAHWQRFKTLKLHKVSACELCLSKERLCLHHKTYSSLGNELPGDVVVLCDKCHKLLHEFIGVIDRTLKAKTEEFIQLMKACAGQPREKIKSKYVAGRSKTPYVPPKPKVKKGPPKKKSWVPVNNGFDL